MTSRRLSDRRANRSRQDSGSELSKINGKITDREIIEYIIKKGMKIANLNGKFVWRKKIEQDVGKGVAVLDELSQEAMKKRQREKEAEIEKLKKRREERAIQKAQREEEMAFLARERARAEFQDWEKREEEFDFEQCKIRSEIRLREGRAKPIDILAKHLDRPSDDFENEPYMVFEGLTVREMEELCNDIKMHLALDRAIPTHIKYWEALLVVCEWELAESRRKDAHGEQLHRGMIGEDRGLHMSIEADVRHLLQGKTYGELEELESDIKSQMLCGGAKLVEFWEAVLKRMSIYKAKACLKEIDAQILERVERPADCENNKTELAELARRIDRGADGAMVSPKSVMEAEAQTGEELAGSYSPQLLLGDEDEYAIDAEEDKAILERKRIAVKEERCIQEMMSLRSVPAEDNFERSAMKAMGAKEEGDVVFGSNDEINLDSKVYWWHDNYRPRKPKYFNRVHSGYEWNKYNQTHYDHENPPPKTVQGYKFNIFYPDLVDKSKAPTYIIEKDGDSTETCIIRFHAGPPYEDIAFRIVNKDWEYSRKKGFKCTFERGILHVYFNFKRYWYRR